MSKLLDYLNTLDKDSNMRAAHMLDPHAARDAFGLTVDEQAAVSSRDQKAIAALAGIDYENFPALDIPQVTWG